MALEFCPLFVFLLIEDKGIISFNYSLKIYSVIVLLVIG